MTENKVDKNKQPNEALDNFCDSMVEMAIDGINKAAAWEQAKTAYWKRQAYILKSKLGRCRDCSNNTNKQKMDDWFYKAGGCECIECEEEENESNRRFIKKYEPRK